jgi:predicted DNA-binding ribbon-helix-helix protein
VSRARSLEKSRVIKRTVRVGHRETSVSLEDAFWDALGEIAASQNLEVSDLMAVIDREREQSNRSSAIRLFVLDHYRKRAAEGGRHIS